MANKNPSSTELHTLICKRDIKLGVACLRTVNAALNGNVQLIVHDDGSFEAADWECIAEMIPTAVTRPRQDVDAQIEEMLSRHPACLRYRRNSAMGIKLFDLPLLCGTSSLSYIDSDVIFLRRIDRLFNTPDDCAVYLRSDEEGYCAPLPELHYRWRTPLAISFNAGLFRLPLSLYDLDRIEWFLGTVFERTGVWREKFLAEQTIWAMLSAKRNCYYFDKRQVFCTRFRKLKLTSSLVAVHLIYHLKPLIPSRSLSLIASWQVLIPFQCAFIARAY